MPTFVRLAGMMRNLLMLRKNGPDRNSPNWHAMPLLWELASVSEVTVEAAFPGPPGKGRGQGGRGHADNAKGVTQTVRKGSRRGAEYAEKRGVMIVPLRSLRLCVAFPAGAVDLRRQNRNQEKKRAHAEGAEYAEKSGEGSSARRGTTNQPRATPWVGNRIPSGSPEGSTIQPRSNLGLAAGHCKSASSQGTAWGPARFGANSRYRAFSGLVGQLVGEIGLCLSGRREIGPHRNCTSADVSDPRVRSLGACLRFASATSLTFHLIFGIEFRPQFRPEP